MTGQLGFLWAVAAVVWFGILFYVVSLIRRQNRMTKELLSVERSLKDITEAQEDGQS
ncbi:CcmD family protein [Alicyclobacillus sp. SO9]|uniref:CcmD family protein n=1 Tax=Alicyclobacillus sp. SO9 TaxID=2665646 RepID=UPI0018E70099|nr:CcmD family protein [Alicyclobacillus sp. SO9]QQE76935.1 CcmD family protein [Alicyclobacillus sp. SO9]